MLTPTTPHFVWSAVTTRRPPGVDERLVGVSLEQVGRREAGSLGHAVDAQEHDVHVDAPQRGDREGPDERVGGRSNAPVRMTLWSLRPPW